MNQVVRYILLFSFLMLIFICLPALVSAQGPVDPGCAPDCNCRDDRTICPIDGGLTALLAIGVAYGIKRYKGSRRTEEA
jgi:hypothetical protein